MIRRTVRVVAVLLLLAGLALVGQFALGLLAQSGEDTAQARQWQDLMNAAQGPRDEPAGGTGLGSGIYLKLTVEKLHKDGIAVDGDWNSLKSASMVHYRASPAPGGEGNVLVAFHRETHWYDINQVGPGDFVTIETVDHHTYRYQVDFMRIVRPSQVDLLQPTRGHDLTLITCDPVWQDYNRMIFRLHLVPPPS